ncbi:hypothetical protein [Kineococcus glutinatus]|uniref:Uncharacterized protein n=1 Tax=Kineococcus glutinatus TaxID=1070872 RepID=A0ABP9H712_9ACTN
MSWDDRPSTWLALAVMFLALSVSFWIDALSGEKTLGFLPAGAFTVSAVLFALHARRCAVRRGPAAPLS